ncbi:mitochondrial mRNA pseudouridine synthase RPUSD3-like [Antedon mediterranea]|uniref:mitochondrial mRNA pseudouridine synthase RPUSD3-like n=1 Tax=Antedon mediterranea TaxID=105859 RepID=UPI003AF649FE
MSFTHLLKSVKVHGRFFHFRRLTSSPSLVTDQQEGTAVLTPKPKKNIFSKSGVLDVSNISRDSLIKVLVASLLFKGDGLLVLSKPAGLSVSGKTKDGQFSLMDVMHDVADGINSPNACLISAPEKETSGIILLAEDKMTANKLNRDIVDASKRSGVKRQYIGLTVGIPEHNQGSQLLHVGQEDIDEELMTVIKSDFSKASLTRQDTKKTKMEYKVLEHNRQLNCALIEMWPQKAYKHQLQVHSTSMLCCILGDHLYSNRVQSVLGVPVLIDPLQAKPGPQKLPKMLREAMNLTASKTANMPLHLHFHQLFIKRPAGDLHITVPLPRYFQRSLQLLGLKMPT